MQQQGQLQQLLDSSTSYKESSFNNRDISTSWRGSSFSQRDSSTTAGEELYQLEG
jgi:hypothetical protein